jgi:uncharacterized protein (TIGR03435 family)
MAVHEYIRVMRIVILFVTAALLAGQTPFEVASVKPSARVLGPDYGNKMTYLPTGFSAKNSTLKRLIAEAYHVQPFQVTGEMKWLESSEYDVEARSGAAASRDVLRTSLQALLTERFHLAIHRETRETHVYNLVGEGRKLKQGASTASFHGDLDHFASFLAVQLTIHGIDDPSKPGMASSAPTPVLNRTGLTGEYDIDAEIRPEPGADMYTLWQRALREQLDLHLESAKAPVEILVIDSADKMPSAN